MKIAICFFGITRSLKHTIKSINEKIFDIFKINNIEYDIFIHTYNLITYKNIRTGEVINDIDNEEYKLLNANYIEIDDQNSIKEKINLLLYRTHKDPWDTNYNSVDNFILGQYSKLRVVQMIEQTKNNYKYILFMRPDCLYLDNFPIKFFDLINDNTIIIPNFDLFGPFKFNDRFCITNMKTYKIYGEVFKQLLKISEKQPLHSETVIGKIMNDNALKIIRIKFNFSRTRFNGYCVDKFYKKFDKKYKYLFFLK
jgi:hypothetical protein